MDKSNIVSWEIRSFVLDDRLGNVKFTELLEQK